jgi:BON domain
MGGRLVSGKHDEYGVWSSTVNHGDSAAYCCKTCCKVEATRSIADKEAADMGLPRNVLISLDLCGLVSVAQSAIGIRLAHICQSGSGDFPNQEHHRTTPRISPFNAVHPNYQQDDCISGGERLQEDQRMQAALAELTSEQSCERYDLSSLARQHLEHHPQFRGRINDVFIEHRGRTLYLTGRVPTFYLKQLVQEAVRHVPGVQNVRNMIDVISADGISSVRC